jgi:hypothetical protein
MVQNQEVFAQHLKRRRGIMLKKLKESMCLCLLIAIIFFSRQAGAANYYVDCSDGDDGNNGRSISEAWRSPGRADNASLSGGDSLFFKRGCTWNSSMHVGWSGTSGNNVYIGAYGEGDKPHFETGGNVISFSGEHVIMEGISAQSSYEWLDGGCADQPTGTSVTINLSSYITLRNVRAAGGSIGIWVGYNSHHNRILYSEIVDNLVMRVNTPGGDDDSGAFGILINGSDTEIGYCHFENNLAWCSYDYGIDGASVEIYNGQRNVIHHNVSMEEGTFTELGGGDTDDSFRRC